MASFRGIPWGERGDGERFPLAGASAEVTEHRLLSGDVVVIPSGQIQGSLKTTARADAATVAALLGAVGEIGTLVLGAATYADALLMEASPREVLASGVFFVDLVFELGVEQRVTPRVGVVIGGREAPTVLAVQTSVGRRQKNATAQLHCLGLPPGDDGDDVQIYVDVGAGPVLIFRGDYDTRAYSFYPGIVTVQCTGLRARLKKKWGGPDRIYNPSLQPDEGGLIQNLIEAAGIPASRTSIESTGWVLGEIQDVIVKNGDSFGAWIDTIDELCGSVTYDQVAGQIERRRDDPVATAPPVATLIEGVNILGIKRQRGGPETIVNQCTVTGLTYEGIEVVQEQKATSAVLDQRQPPELRPYYQGETIKSDLIETDGRALQIATRIVGDKNRRDDHLEIQLPLTPALRPGDGLRVTASSVGAADARLLIVDVKHDIGGETGTTTLITNTGTL